MTKMIDLSQARVGVEPNSRRTLKMTEYTGASVKLPTGEVVEITRSVTSPFVFFLRGEKLEGSIDFTAIVTEAVLHVRRENAAPVGSEEASA